MRLIGLLVLLLACVGCAGSPHAPPAPQADEAQDYDFRVGTQWTYAVKRNGETFGKQILRVTKIEDGVTHLTGKSGRASGSTASFTQLHWIRGGGLWVASDARTLALVVSEEERKLASEKALRFGEMLYKLGTKKGDRWPTFPEDTTSEHQGKVVVQVPAGTYKDAIHIKLLADKDGWLLCESWLVPKVGWVKHVVGPVVMELEKFEEPSK